MVIFGYDEFIKGQPANNGFKFKDGKSPVNLGFAGYKTDHTLKDSQLQSLKENFVPLHRHHNEQLLGHFDISIQKVSEILEPYYYVIDIYPHDFWSDPEAKYPIISDQAITHIKNKKAKILVLFPTEGLYPHNDVSGVLNTWAANYGLPHRSIVLVSGNYAFGDNVERDKCITYIPFTIWEHVFRKFYNIKVKYQLIEAIKEKKDREKVFLNYNRRARYPRCKLVYELERSGLIDKGFVSLGEYIDYDSRKHLPTDFLNKLPITFDDTDLEVNHAGELIHEDFLNSYVSLVSETDVFEGTMFPTEKIFKAIVGMHPFVLLGSPGFLRKLREFGYQTFSRWFDESYDDETNLHRRIDMVIGEIRKLTLKTDEELKDMLVEMFPVLQHNLDTFLRRTKEKTFQEELEAELWK